MSFRLPLAVGLFLTAVLPLDGSEPGPRFILKDGDRVVFLGNGFIEQDRLYGHLEARLTSRHPNAQVVFRNLGWGGDTVRGSARTGGYQNPEGFARLLKEVQDLKPTVIFLGYGMNESFDGPPGLAGFIEDYDRLLGKLAPLKARLVILSPTWHEDLGRPFPEPAEHNRTLEQYVAALKQLAARRELRFIDLFHPLQAAKQADLERCLTINGIHLNEAGYALVARAVEEQLGLCTRAWRVELDHEGKVLASEGTRVDTVTAANGVLRFRALDAMLPLASPAATGDKQVLRVTGLKPGAYALTIDGQEVFRAEAADWQRGVTLTAGPAFTDGRKLREAVIHKNQLFYRRWRPFNDHSRHWGYIRGDFQLYDQEIAREEQVIAYRRQPRPHTYAISAKGETK